MTEYIKNFIEKHKNRLDDFDGLLDDMAHDTYAVNTKAHLLELYEIFEASGVNVKEDASRFLYRYIKEFLSNFKLNISLDTFFNRIPKFDFTAEELRSILEDVVNNHYPDCYMILLNRGDNKLYLHCYC